MRPSGGGIYAKGWKEEEDNVVPLPDLCDNPVTVICVTPTKLGKYLLLVGGGGEDGEGSQLLLGS